MGMIGHADLFSAQGFLQCTTSKHVPRTLTFDAAVLNNKTFTSVVAANSKLPLSSAPPAPKQGVFHAIKISNNVYTQRLALCQHSLIAIVVLGKGESP